MKESSNPIIADDTSINNLPEGTDESIDNIIIVIENKKREKLNYELKQKLKENLDIISKLNNNLKKAI